MREIKLRGWNGKQMLYSPAIVMKEGGLIEWNYGELMQFTGLKDKKGKEIYEGDIVNQGGWNGVVNLIRDFWGTDDGNYDDSNLFERRKNYEVIGNIYENPELLK